MLGVLMLLLEIMQEEASPFGLEINWDKTNIQTSRLFSSSTCSGGWQCRRHPWVIYYLGSLFTYLGCLINSSGSCEAERYRAGLHDLAVSQHLVPTKLRLYAVYVLPLFCMEQRRAMTKAMSAKVDAFNQRCLRHILVIQYSQHVSDAEVRRHTVCPPLSDTIRSRRLRLVGYIARVGPEINHHRALHDATNQLINNPPRDWKRRRGKPAPTWTRHLPGPALLRPTWSHVTLASTLGLYLMASSAGPKYMEQTCADSYAPASLGPVWSPLLIIIEHIVLLKMEFGIRIITKAFRNYEMRINNVLSVSTIGGGPSYSRRRPYSFSGTNKCRQWQSNK